MSPVTITAVITFPGTFDSISPCMNSDDEFDNECDTTVKPPLMAYPVTAALPLSLTVSATASSLLFSPRITETIFMMPDIVNAVIPAF